MFYFYLVFTLYLLFPNYSFSNEIYFPPLNGDQWETSSPESLEWCESEIDPLLQFLEENNTKAFIVLKDGKIVIEKYFDNFTQDSTWYWASAGKTITSFLIGLAKQNNFLSLSDKSSDYLGEKWTNLTKNKEDLITIRNQLTMTTGLNDGVKDNDCTIDTCLIYLQDAGKRWAYHNAPYTLFDNVIENSTGDKLNIFLYKYLNQFIGMKGAFFKIGFNNFYISKSRDMARFGLLMLNGGNWNGNQIMTDTKYYNDMINTSQEINESYGYLWWLNGKDFYMLPGLQTIFNGSISPDAPADMYSALGLNSQILNIVPSQNLITIRMGDIAEIEGGLVPYILNNNIWKKLNKVICNIKSVDISKKNNKYKVNIYPNPAQNQINIDLSTINKKIPSLPFQVKIYNSLGSKIIDKLINPNSPIDILYLDKGVYSVLVTINGINYSTKFVVIK